MDSKDLKEMQREYGVAPSFLQENEVRTKRWAHLTEGLNDYDRLVMETLLDNTKRWEMFETSQTRNVGTFTTYGYPLIRRVFPNLIANELVSVQPMTQPTGLIFFLDFLYGTSKGGVTAGDNLADGSKFNPYYAGGTVRGEVLGEGTGEEKTFDLAYGPIVADSEVVYVDGIPVSGYTIANGKITITAAEGAAITVDYQVSPGEGDDVPEIDFDMTSTDVQAESKKLKAKWTLEAQQDLMAYHGLSAESELLAVLGDQIRREIDRAIINDLYDNASAGNVNWSAEAPSDFSGSDREYRMTLYDAIIDANTLIYKRRYRNANWIVADPDTCSLLEKLDGFKELNNDAGVGGAGLGVEQFGILRNRFTVYKDPWATANKLLLGYKGNTFMETGYVYAPYIPLYTTPVITDPNDFTPRRGVMTRYARKPVITDFYATVTVQK